MIQVTNIHKQTHCALSEFGREWVKYEFSKKGVTNYDFRMLMQALKRSGRKV